MKTTDILAKNNSDIVKLIADKREALRVFRFGGAGAKTKNVREGRVIRKDIARLFTVLNAKDKVKLSD